MGQILDSERTLRRYFSDALRPPPDLTVSEWAGGKGEETGSRILDSRSSPEPGPWRNERTPYLVEFMNALGPSVSAKRVVGMFASQLGKTEGLLNAAGYYIDHDPCPMMMVQPTDKAMERFSRQRITPLIESSPALADKVADRKSRQAGNTLGAKEYEGGVWLLVGANSPTDLSSSPIRILLCDEVDRWPRDLGVDGDPLGLAEARTRNFFNRKIGIVSTPTKKGESRIEVEFLRSDQRFFEVPCPHCGVSQRLKWARVKWPTGRPELAVYTCEGCEEPIAHTQKRAMLAGGAWIAEDEEVAELRRSDPTFDTPLRRDPEAVGFHLSTLYSPWFSWADMAEAFVKCARDPVLLKVFINTLLGETWDDLAGESIDGHALLSRREDYGPGSNGPELPEGVGVLTAGVDFQADRATIEVVGWGAGEESWSIEVVDVYGDPSVPPKDDGSGFWRELDNVLATTYSHELGGRLGIEAACLDSGHQALNVYAYVKPRQRRRVWAIKGKDGSGKLWPKTPTRRNKGRVDLYVIRVDPAKEQIYARLRIEEPGPGYCHFNLQNDAAFFSELTAERKKTRFKRGHRVTYWELPSGRRNEALDRRVYALAGLHGWRQGRRTIGGALDKMRERSEPDKLEAAERSKRSKKTRRTFLGGRRDHWLKG